MNMQLIYFSSVLVLMMGAIIAVPAQESNALLFGTSNATLNNTTINNTATNVTLIDTSAANSTLPVAPAQNDNSSGSAVPPVASRNSSTGDSRNVPISADLQPASSSLVAGSAPETAVAASSDQIASELESFFKIGAGVGGARPFPVKDEDVSTFQIGVPIKPLRDTGKMFFVCDIV